MDDRSDWFYPDIIEPPDPGDPRRASASGCCARFREVIHYSCVPAARSHRCAHTRRVPEWAGGSLTPVGASSWDSMRAEGRVAAQGSLAGAAGGGVGHQDGGVSAEPAHRGSQRRRPSDPEGRLLHC